MISLVSVPFAISSWLTITEEVGSDNCVLCSGLTVCDREEAMRKVSIFLGLARVSGTENCDSKDVCSLGA